MIHLSRGATSLGVFSEEEVDEGLRSGRFAPTIGAAATRLSQSRWTQRHYLRTR